LGRVLKILIGITIFSVFAGCSNQSQTIRYEPTNQGLALAREAIFVLETIEGQKYEIHWQPEYPLLTEFYFWGYYLGKDGHLHHLKIPREEVKSIKIKEPSQMRRFILGATMTRGLIELFVRGASSLMELSQKK